MKYPPSRRRKRRWKNDVIYWVRREPCKRIFSGCYHQQKVKSLQKEVGPWTWMWRNRNKARETSKQRLGEMKNESHKTQVDNKAWWIFRISRPATMNMTHASVRSYNLCKTVIHIVWDETEIGFKKIAIMLMLLKPVCRNPAVGRPSSSTSQQRLLE